METIDQMIGSARESMCGMCVDEFGNVSNSKSKNSSGSGSSGGSPFGSQLSPTNQGVVVIAMIGQLDQFTKSVHVLSGFHWFNV